MAFSRQPITSDPCEHENGKPLAMSADTIEYIKQSWHKIQDHGLVPTGIKLYSRLKREATPDEMDQMNRCFMILDTGPFPMREHCNMIITILNDVIMNKLNCTSCVREKLRRISNKHMFFGLRNSSELYKPVRLSIKWVLEDIIQDGFSSPAWDEFFASLQSILDELGPCC